MALFSEMMDELGDAQNKIMRLRAALEVFANRASAYIAPEETVTFFMSDCMDAANALKDTED